MGIWEGDNGSVFPDGWELDVESRCLGFWWMWILDLAVCCWAGVWICAWLRYRGEDWAVVGWLCSSVILDNCRAVFCFNLRAWDASIWALIWSVIKIKGGERIWDTDLNYMGSNGWKQEWMKTGRRKRRGIALTVDYCFFTRRSLCLGCTGGYFELLFPSHF